MSGGAGILPSGVSGPQPQYPWLHCAVCGEPAGPKRTLIRWYSGDATELPVLASCVDCTLHEVARAVKLATSRNNPVDAGKSHPVSSTASSTQAPSMQQPQMSLLPDPPAGGEPGRATGYEQ
jgi:hypothetical protein